MCGELRIFGEIFVQRKRREAREPERRDGDENFDDGKSARRHGPTDVTLVQIKAPLESKPFKN